MWNMAKGKCSYHTKLTSPAEAVAFSPSGAAYALITASSVSLHTTEGEGALLQTLAHDRKVLCMAYAGEHTVLTGALFKCRSVGHFLTGIRSIGLLVKSLFL